MTEDSYFDFSAMLEKAVAELTDNTDLRTRMAERVKYVVVDEYQDVNPIQERLVQLLHDLGAGLCVVGDDDQTIYQWRGSSVDNIRKFQDRYPGVEQIRLEANFRSSEGVIETARDFIATVSPRLAKAMKFADAQTHEDGDVVARSFESPEEEAEYIVETVKSLRGVAFNDGDGERGLSWPDMAVLLRSVKHNGAVITKALKESGIPFVVIGQANLFETDEACAARSLFYFIAGGNPKSSNPPPQPTEGELRQAWEKLRLGLSKQKVGEAVAYAKKVRDTLNAQDGEKPPGIQDVFLKFLKLAELREEGVPDKLREMVLFNLGRFSRAIGDWESVNFYLGRETFQEFASFLQHQADGFYGEGPEDDNYGYMTRDAVQVMTVHQAKGREWPVVFMPALLQNRFPAVSRKSDIWQLIPKEAIKHAQRYDGSNEDERRLFYVAMTRSKKFLHMTWAPIAGKRNRYVRKSEFWEQCASIKKWVSPRKPDYSQRKRLTPASRGTVGDVRFAFSDLRYLLQCGYQFKLNVLYGFQIPINGRHHMALEYGNSLHDALAEVHQRAMRGEPVGEADVPGLVKRHLPRRLRPSKLEDAVRQRVVHYIRDNPDVFQGTRHVEQVEQDVEFHLDDGVSVKGRIDLVRSTHTEQTTIVDLKSSALSQSERVTDDQLHVYALGYKELSGKDVNFVEIYDLKERRWKRRPVDENVMGNVRKKVGEAAAELRKRRLKAAPDKDKCRWCDFSALCSQAVTQEATS